MIPKTWEEAAQLIANEIVEFISRKQHDYGHENILAFGELGILVRANDKIARLRNLQGKEGVTEPRLDAWKDLAGYAIIALMLDRGWFILELGGKMTQCADCGRLICCDDIYRYRGKDYCEDCANTVRNLDKGGRFYGEKLIKEPNTKDG